LTVWQAITAVAALITAVGGASLGAVGLVRSGRESGAKERAEAASVGLEYLERALATQQDTIVRQQGEIGELRGKLEHCESERHGLADQVAELRGRMP
jgi:predicted RNase H-like nuclease (RuvC/YqgF family)